MTPPLARRQPLVDELLRRFGAALRGSQLYAPGHPLVTRNTAAFTEALLELLAGTPSLSIGLLADEVIVGDQPMPRGAAALGDLFGRLKARGVERISFEKGVTADELLTTVDALCRCLSAIAAGEVQALDLPHVHVGVLTTDKRAAARPADMAMVRTLHAQVTTTMRAVWGRACQEGTVDASMASGVVDELAHVMSQNREALIALTAIRSSDDYTFTHMVNVSILTMMQAQGLGIDGPLLREFGIAGLMHDIGKVHTPPAILSKPTRLDHEETVLVRRHPIDGAQILRRTMEFTPLAAVVAFEHHLRLDGTGYPAAVKRDSLNLASMLCAVADVYDAMRSRRHYQDAFPADRILEVLRRGEGRAFEHHLVRRFVQLMGLYPVGSFVRLNTGAYAVVLRPSPADPGRPRVRVVYAPDGRRLEVPYDVDLWNVEPDPHRSSSVTGPVAAPNAEFDPLTVM
jgi:putative nucleotidyltransferase with HDIG domain